MADLRVDIAAEFTGRKAFKDADKATGALDKTIGKLGKQLAGVFAVSKVVAFGKASLKAFEEDQKSAALLANTVKNLGLAFATPQLESFIASLSKSAAVSDDQLRPAMQKLLTTTGSLAKSQTMLSDAISISRGSGVDLATVVQDLNNAYVGNTKGLKKYNLGLTQAELKASSFADIQTKLNAQFSGANAAYLDTYAGKMAALGVAAGEAKETIGKGLVDALTLLAGKDADVQDVADAMGNLSENVANVSVGLASVISKIGQLPGLKQLGSSGIDWFKVLAPQYWFLAREGKRTKSSALAPSSANTHLQELQAASNAKATAAAEKAAAKRAKELAKATATQTKEIKSQALTKKQQGLLDIQQAQIMAALQGNITKEERIRLELQLALLQGNEAKAASLSKELANSIDATGNLAKWLTTLPDANNPFKNWDAFLDTVIAKAKLAASIGSATAVVPSLETLTDFSGFAMPTTSPGQSGSAAQFGANTPWAQAAQNVVVQIDGKTIASALMDQSLSGNQAYVNRRTGGFE